MQKVSKNKIGICRAAKTYYSVYSIKIKRERNALTLLISL